jgi:hypothetical protein
MCGLTPPFFFFFFFLYTGKACPKAPPRGRRRGFGGGVAVSPTLQEDMEDAVAASGGTKQLDKLRRQRDNKRDREDGSGTVYDWEEETGLGAGGDVQTAQEQDPATAYQQYILQQQQQMYVAMQQQQQQQQQAILAAPPDLTLLDVRVLNDVEPLLRELAPERLADLVLENMINWAAVGEMSLSRRVGVVCLRAVLYAGAKPGEDAFFELAAVARDPRLSERKVCTSCGNVKHVLVDKQEKHVPVCLCVCVFACVVLSLAKATNTF